MAIWDKFKDAKKRLFDGIDALDDRARDADVSAEARRHTIDAPGPRELTGGLEELELLDAAATSEPSKGDVSFSQEEVTEITELPLDVFEEADDEVTVGEFLVDDELMSQAEAELDDPDSEEQPMPTAPGQRYPNSLNIADVLVEASLRMQHYPELSAPPEHLHVLAHSEHELLLSSAFVGYALKQLVDEVIDHDGVWCSAVLFSGMLVDGEVREALNELRRANHEAAARNLCWAAEPFLEEVVGAAEAGEAHDGVGLGQAVRDLQHWLIRWRGTAVDMGLDPDPPLLATGLHRLPGFRWC